MQSKALNEIMQSLTTHAQDMQNFSLSEAFKKEDKRFEHYVLSVEDITFDFSKNLIVDETMQLLTQLATLNHLSEKIQNLFKGEIVNKTENSSALHTLLRTPGYHTVSNNQDKHKNVQNVQARLNDFVRAIHAHVYIGATEKIFTDVVNIGIGGSYWGPVLGVNALADYCVSDLHFHFIANIDSVAINQLLKKLNPETTLFIISSKSFTTQETLLNAEKAKSWAKARLREKWAKHFVAVTAHVNKAKAFGIAENNIFPIWEWVGGRYSIWSAIGLPLLLAIGVDNFQQFLSGAHEVDNHFINTPFEKNIPVIMGLLGIWYLNFLSANSHIILPYDELLSFLPAYLQQLDMESNGKCFANNDKPVTWQTAPIVWGQTGCLGQHSFYQLLHQGTHFIPADFIVSVDPNHDEKAHHELLVANCFSQAQALAEGKSKTEIKEELIKNGLPEAGASCLASHQSTPGNRPSNMFLLKRISPRTLGALLALYEHKVFVQSVIWNINPFDQMGVMLGKRLANTVLPVIQDKSRISQTSDTMKGLLACYHRFVD